ALESQLSPIPCSNHPDNRGPWRPILSLFSTTETGDRLALASTRASPASRKPTCRGWRQAGKVAGRPFGAWQAALPQPLRHASQGPRRRIDRLLRVRPRQAARATAPQTKPARPLRKGAFHIPTDLVVAREASAVESCSRLDFLLLHNLGTRFVAP